MNPVNELCSLHDYIEKHFENVEFISAETPVNSWNKDAAKIVFKSGGRKYRYVLTDETKEES
jgi:hypothetical protein